MGFDFSIEYYILIDCNILESYLIVLKYDFILSVYHFVFSVSLYKYEHFVL